MAHVVIVALVVARDSIGADVYLYEGAVVPANIPLAEVERLEHEKFIAKVGADEPAFPDGDPAETWKVDQLKAFAAAKSIDLGDAKSKSDILAAISAAQD